jgi:uncharacterized membrane protein
VGVRSSNRGFVLVVTCIALAILLAFAVLGIDIGRMRVIKSELQAFTDAAALNAALQLDGTESGLIRARAAAKQLASGPHAMKWDMGTQPITAIAASFAKGDQPQKPSAWQNNPENATGYRFVRIRASAPAPIIFFRVFQTLAESPVVAAASVAVSSPPNARLVE